MNNFPLSPFLASLASDGIRVNVRDYERIGLALQTGGKWTVARLRDVIVSLLAKDQERQDILLRRFNAFFELDTDAENAFTDIDIRQVLADLNLLAQETDSGVRKSFFAGGAKNDFRTPEEEKTKPRVRFRFLAALSVALVLGLTAIWYYIFPKEEPCELGVNLSSLNFSVKAGAEASKKIVLTNIGKSSLQVKITIQEADKDNFSIAGNYSSVTIHSGGTIEPDITFSPALKDNYNASLLIVSDAACSPHEVALTGTVRPDEKIVSYVNVPFVKNIKEVPFQSDEWKKFAGIAAVFFIIIICYGIYLWRSRKIPEDKEADWSREGRRHFPLGSIGGKPDPWLNDDVLNQLADSMGYFMSQQESSIINVPASVEATMDNGGIPRLEFFKRRRIRSLLILEDAFAEAGAWNPVAGELAQGMIKRGVPVLHGRFGGSPVVFKTEGGAVHRLEDLEDQRRGYLLFVFTDGKWLGHHENTFALESLARWPMAAWMELREPRSWDETVVMAEQRGIPVFHASPKGTLDAVRNFLTEKGGDKELLGKGVAWKGMHGIKPESYLERVLGDCLIWAQDCAMIQPVGLGLADAVRRKFHSHLPCERVERLYMLPETVHNVSGLHFSDEVLAVLRKGFLTRRDEDEQEDVLKFLLEKVNQAEPDGENSLAHLSWEFMRERLIMELYRDYDYERLAQLAKTPIGKSVSAGLEGFGFSGEKGKIPLRVRPKNKDALQRLARIAPDFEIPVLKAYPIGLKSWVVLGTMIICMMGFSFGSAVSYRNPSEPDINWEITGYDFEKADLEIRKNGEWQKERSGKKALLLQKPLTIGSEYRIVFHKQGFEEISKGFKAVKSSLTSVVVDMKKEKMQHTSIKTNFTGMKLIFVKGGRYKMGDNFGDGYDNETVHDVNVSDFYIGKYEVTFKEYDMFCEDTGKEKPDDERWGRADRPVINVSWEDAVVFAEWLSQKTGDSYRLPTEAEWEYAARSGGKMEKYSGFSDDALLYQYANFCDKNCDYDSWKDKNQDDGYQYTAPVGSYKPNGLGLYDMSGNVWEWCQDWYGDYPSSDITDPPGPNKGSFRVLRGGSWGNVAGDCRTARRIRNDPGGGGRVYGFRLALLPGQQGSGKVGKAGKGVRQDNAR
ncbi:MAG: SUMF1/EgtB/PvdO family nonheme iron enzyme [Desulfobacteraceae bacterium]|nr:SUMF1/EgtB/PvdO family nonheme iron enzyme [Desulfobacteraceae bacterium]